MASGFFVLLRFFLRVDGVMVRMNDTRIYHQVSTALPLAAKVTSCHGYPPTGRYPAPDKRVHVQRGQNSRTQSKSFACE